MMQKRRGLELTSWAAMALSAVIAFALVFFQWRQQLHARTVKDRLSRQLVQQAQAASTVNPRQRTLLDTLTEVEGGREKSDFLDTLNRLTHATGVKQVQLELVPFSQLPIMEGSPGAATSVPGDIVPGEPALAHLPLNVSALSMRLTVEGTYSGVYHFLQGLQRSRQKSRVVNTNSVTIETLHDGKVRATITVTRFIRTVSPTSS